MSSLFHRKRAMHTVFWPLIVLLIIADQLTKAYFVWLLSNHGHSTLPDFLREYFQLWNDGTYQHILMAKYGMFEQVWLLKPWLSWHLTTNTGAAWSLFAGNSFVLSFVSIAMAILLVIVWWGRFRFHEPMTWALGAIVGGALGNFIDRFRLREVVDFIDVRIPWIGHLIKGSGPHYDFPIFNIADSAAVLGTLGLAVYLISTDIKSWRRRGKTREDFKPIEEGLRLDEPAVKKLKLAAERKRNQLPVRTDLGLTVHVSAPPNQSNTD